jgi:protoporphyrin/coproporphyrin ferrochelatase
MNQVASNKIGVLVAQLGTPDAPTPKALRSYLRQFLSDQRVIDYPPILWQSILRGIILNVRPRKSARLYGKIWLDEGSPLLVYSQRQVAGLQARLGNDYAVVLGMTYGNPSIKSALHDLEAEGSDRILIFPMYPQYSSTTTASVYDAVFRAAAGKPQEHKRFVPALRVVPPFYEHPGYIAALNDQIGQEISAWGKTPDKVVLSFHGIPTRYVQTGDPYPAHCQITAQRLADALQLSADQWVLSYQSRFGPEPWLDPATNKVLESLPESGCKSVIVVSPGFVADCLETLYELGHEGLEQFQQRGGQAENYRLVPCLNDHSVWLDTLAEIVRHESASWIGS